jgi:lipopolysaccharide/colanic/teichoic acid biosynthesis glycosyltransferase
MLTASRSLRPAGREVVESVHLQAPAPPRDLRQAVPEHPGYVQAKVVVEWILGLLLLVLTSPVVLFIAALVKFTSRGPAFYAQTRLGLNGRTYRIYKLRTMVQNAEMHCGPVWAAKDDERVTGLGRFLRKTHLDEMPQLLNVIRGEMALIGPRPERPEIAARIERAVPEFGERLRVRPGVTGLAQMLLPADDPEDRHYACARLKLSHDLVYVRQVSLLLDIRIAISTGCYFAGAAIEAMQKGIVGGYRVRPERPVPEATACEGAQERFARAASHIRFTEGGARPR